MDDIETIQRLKRNLSLWPAEVTVASKFLSWLHFFAPFLNHSSVIEECVSLCVCVLVTGVGGGVGGGVRVAGRQPFLYDG